METDCEGSNKHLCARVLTEIPPTYPSVPCRVLRVLTLDISIDRLKAEDEEQEEEESEEEEEEGSDAEEPDSDENGQD